MTAQSGTARLKTHADELLSAGKQDIAALFLERVVNATPMDTAALAQLAMIRERQGQVLPADRAARRVLRAKASPHAPLAYLVLGNLARRAGQRQEAVRAYQAALSRNPGLSEAQANLGATLVDLGRDPEALPYLENAVRTMPQSAEACFNLGTALIRLGRRAEAAEPLLRALVLRPDLGQAWNLLGGIAIALSLKQVAEICFSQATQVQPSAGSPIYNLGLVMQETGRQREAVEAFRRALQLDPGLVIAEGALCHQLQFLCAWDEVAPQARRVLELLRNNEAHVVEPFSLLSVPGATASDHARAGRLFAQRHVAGTAPLVERNHAWQDGRTRLRIGYLCADFRQHPTARLIADVLEMHDREAVETIALTFGVDDGSPLRKRILSSFDGQLDLNPSLTISVEEAARKVAELRLDVLVDLMCFTRGAEPGIPALRPAPVQVQYLVLPGTSGSEFYDYAVVDSFVASSPVAESYSEQPMLLDPCYMPFYLPPQDLPCVTRAEAGLPALGTVFGCFNQSYKISQDSFQAWCAILRAVPDSVLWILEPPAEAMVRIREAAAARGVDPTRIIFAPAVSNELHLARTRLVDISLDTWPYNAHTTAVDALLQRVPVVTLPGDTFPSRVAGSILHSLGLAQLVAASHDEFVRVAVALALDEDFARTVHHRLEQETTRTAIEKRMRDYVRNFERQLRLARGWPEPDAMNAADSQPC